MIKVLVADDEEKVCQLICSLIDWQQLDMQVVGTAHNGQQALDMVGRLRPDIVITDIRMPGYDGLELIRRIKDKYDGVQFIIISGYRQFDYAQNAIRYGVSDYLLKPIKKEELHATLSKMRDEYRHSQQQTTLQERMEIRLQEDMDKLRCGLLNDLLQNRQYAGDMDMQSVNNSYHYSFRQGCFQMFIMKIDGQDDGGQMSIIEEKALYGLQSALKTICYDMQAYLVGSRIYGVMNYPPEDTTAIRRTLNSALDDLCDQAAAFGCALTVGLGSNELDIDGLPHSLGSAQEAIYQRYMDSNARIIEGERISEQGFDSHSLLVDLQKRLGTALELMDREAISRSLEAFGSGALDTRPAPTGRELYTMVMEAYSTCLILLRNYDDTEDIETLAGEMEREADCCGSGDKLLRLLSNKVLARLDELPGRSGAEGSPVRTAKQYINENYMNPLSLDVVAESVGFNPSYFSTLFKKESGQNFQDYVSEVRMNMAKELLKDTNDTIANICAKVGYSDTKHFTQSFKKHTGLKPKEYRQLFS